MIEAWHLYIAILTGVLLTLTQTKKIWAVVVRAGKFLATPVLAIQDLSDAIKHLTCVVSDVQATLHNQERRITSTEQVAVATHAKLNMVFEASERAYFECNPKGVCTWVNTALAHLFGMEREKCLDSGWLASLHPDDIDRVRSHWMQTVQAWTPYRVRYRILMHGKTKLCEASAEVIRNVTGEAISIWGRVDLVSSEGDVLGTE
jgi:PAS domain S-box-containing protein